MGHDSHRVLAVSGIISLALSAAASGQPETWALVATSGPSSRYDSPAVFDSARQRVFLFGGSGSTSDSWEWGDSGWQERMTGSQHPSPRSAHALAYDAAHSRVVLFGGASPTGSSLGDTWEWDGTVWTERTPALSPAARSGACMVFDAARARVVLFGGRTEASPTGYPSDTWEWDGTNWTQRFPTQAPPGRFLHAMAFDPVRQRVVLFGGEWVGSYWADTWEWDGTNWAQVSAAGPSARWRAGMAWDGLEVLLFGGYPGYLADTWAWNGVAWSQRQPAISPPGRNGHSCAFDSSRRQVIVFGGVSESQWFGDTWAWGPVCYANCDTSTASPILNIIDFICFQLRYAQGNLYANCDGSTLPPVLNVNDFFCFINRYAAGCP